MPFLQVSISVSPSEGKEVPELPLHVTEAGPLGIAARPQEVRLPGLPKEVQV